MKRLAFLLLCCSLAGCTSTRTVAPPSINETIDDGGGGGGAPPATTFNVPTSGSVSATGTIVIPIALADYDGSGGGSKGFQVTVLLSAGLQLASSVGAACQPGTYLTGSGCGNDPSPIFSATQNSDGTYTLVAALNPGKQSHCAGGTVFNVSVTPRTEHSGPQYVGLTGSPAGAVTTSPTLRNACCNADIPVSYGNATDTITIQ